jgi:hypothetical protein
MLDVTDALQSQSMKVDWKRWLEDYSYQCSLCLTNAVCTPRRSNANSMCVLIVRDRYGPSIEFVPPQKRAYSLTFDVDGRVRLRRKAPLSISRFGPAPHFVRKGNVLIFVFSTSVSAAKRRCQDRNASIRNGGCEYVPLFAALRSR